MKLSVLENCYEQFLLQINKYYIHLKIFINTIVFYVCLFVPTQIV